MVRYTGVWAPEGVTAYLEGAVVPVRLACRTPAGRLWMLSLWFAWDPDAETFACATARDADVVRYLEADPEVAFEVSSNDPPYRGVRGNGTASIRPDEEKRQLRRLLKRYLGGTDSALARRLLDPGREEVRITVDPARVHSWDYSGRMDPATDADGDANANADGE
jgi:nitroimidazol reductase NimA-like FMN-containing flavoprotein (pyridoxamine 5'-phosphate oxidase superfamily)